MPCLLFCQVREKTDKFQQRRLDGFFRAGMKACNEACASEEPQPHQPGMPEVVAMEVEMEVRAKPGSDCPRVPSHQVTVCQAGYVEYLDTRTKQTSVWC